MQRKRLTGREAAALVVAAIIFIFCGLVIGWHFGYQGLSPFSTAGKLSLSDLDRAYNLVNSEYYAATDTAPLVGDSIAAFVGGLGDRYSFYLSAAEYKKIKDQENGILFDVGVLFVTRNKQGLILEVYPGTPAAAAGLAPGDIITKINSTDTAVLPGALPITEALFGKAGEPVTVTVLKKGGALQTLSLVHASYKTPTVAFKLLSPGVGYLKIYSFDPQLATDFAPIEQSIGNEHLTKLVIDLRNNPGGDVDTAIAMTNKFLYRGIIFSEQLGRNGGTTVFSAARRAEFPDVPVRILVNNLTASAAEIFTAALQENHRAIVIGTTTEGKATEQAYFTLGDGSAIRLSIGRWFAPNGDWLNGKGITPNFLMPDNSGTTDAPLVKALTL